MPDRPETRKVWNGESALAYQVVGSGEPPLLYLQGWVSNVELNWDQPVVARFLRGLSRGRTLIVADPRGTGVSERSSPEHVWPLEVLAEDIGVVLAAAGCTRAAILATVECSSAALMFAATYPERVTGLILFEATANWLWSEETPWEWTEEQFAEQEERFRLPTTLTQVRRDLEYEAPSLLDAPGFVEWWYRYNLLSAGAGFMIASARKYMHTDLRPILPSINVPLLVLHRPQHPVAGWSEAAHFLAARVAGASARALPGNEAYIWTGDQRPVLRAVDTFLDELRLEEIDFDRVLTTVLFTDIVASTETAAALGDAAWRDVLMRHHATVRTLLERYRGTEVDTAGDGFFSTFDGPARAVRCARAVVRDVRSLGLEVRAGIHTGEVEILNGKVGGVAVHLGARLAAAAEPSEVLVTRTVKDLVAGSGLAFEDCGERQIKGLRDPWHVYRVLEPLET